MTDAADYKSMDALVRSFGGRSLVLVGMMGSGKTSVGRRLAHRLGFEFADADAEIEAAAGMSIPEFFARHGEAEFRDGERRVVARILARGQKVVALGGGAFMNESTRERIAERGISIWLQADFDVLLRRIRKRSNRPMLYSADPEAVLRRLLDERTSTYALADFTVASRDGPHDLVVDTIISELRAGAAICDSKAAVETPSPQDSAVSVMIAEPIHSSPLPPYRAEDAPDVTIVPVELAARGYDIRIGSGLLAQAGAAIAGLAPGARCAIVTDRNVAGLYLEKLEAALDAAGVAHVAVTVSPGEATKSYAGFAEVCDAILDARLERGDLVVALGGGVVGDLAGFAAACIRRGMRYVQMPTTLLAQVDSSIGGKTAIDTPQGKNLIGAFHQPSLVIADTDVLATLSPREFRAGYAEVLKYGLIDRPDFYAWLERHWQHLFAGGPELAEAIATSCRAKAEIVARDETEQGDRALLNLGHTFGHAFERLSHYDGDILIHGEGVAVGMAMAFRFSTRLGLCSGQDAGRLEAHLRDVGLPTHVQQIAGLDANADALLAAMYQDKKVSRGALTFILTHGIGQAFIAKDIGADEARAFLQDELTGS